MQLIYIRKVIKNLHDMFVRKKKFFIILNYHRIGNVNPENPFHRLHTVPFTTFKIQIKICRALGTIVSLNDIDSGKLKSKLSFAITFDDVSASAIEAFNWLEQNNISFAICPCQKITEKNIGWRDKVYFIEKYIHEKDIENLLKKNFSDVSMDFKENFYTLSKNPKFDQDKMIIEVVDYLYKKIPNNYKIYFNEKNYLDAEAIRHLKENSKNITIVNHSVTHTDNTKLSIARLNAEIEQCDIFIEKITHEKPSHFAIPFGVFDPALCVGLCEAARTQDKKAILWVENRLNIYAGKTINKVKQYCRFHTSSSVLGLIRQVIVSFFKLNFLEEITTREVVSDNRYKLVSNPEIDKIIAFEDLSRPNKDYSGSKEILQNFYIANPFLGQSPHTFAQMKNERIFALGQNLALPFFGLQTGEIVNFFGNWRAISGSSSMATAAILGRALKEFDIVASYKPSKIIEPTFVKLGWQKVSIQSFHASLDKVKIKEKSFDLSICTQNEEIYGLQEYNFEKSNFLQLKLSQKLLDWRVQNYQLAQPIYFQNKLSSSKKALVVAQFNSSSIMLLDQRFSSEEALFEILEQIVVWSKERNFSQIILETSCLTSKNIFEKIFYNASKVESACYFRFSERSDKKKKIILTPLASDILLRASTV